MGNLLKTSSVILVLGVSLIYTFSITPSYKDRSGIEVNGMKIDCSLDDFLHRYPAYDSIVYSEDELVGVYTFLYYNGEKFGFIDSTLVYFKLLDSNSFIFFYGNPIYANAKTDNWAEIMQIKKDQWYKNEHLIPNNSLDSALCFILPEFNTILSFHLKNDTVRSIHYLLIP